MTLPLGSRQVSSVSLPRLGETAGELFALLTLLFGALLMETFGVGEVGRPDPVFGFEIVRLTGLGEPTWFIVPLLVVGEFIGELPRLLTVGLDDTEIGMEPEELLSPFLGGGDGTYYKISY